MLHSKLSGRFKTIRNVHDAFNNKTISVTELTKLFLDAAKQSQSGAILAVCEERSLRKAQEMDRLLSKEGKLFQDRYPLFGVPIGIKDNMALEGVKTTCGSKILANYIPPYTGTAVQRLEDAGAICIAKMNLDEFAMGGSNENSAFGPVKHPTHPEHVPGGSSGGSAAAVRAGLCIAATGSDTGGSIRLPASYCGIVGMKPSYGRVSRYGLVAFASSLDQIGPMTHTVEDTATLLQVMSGQDSRDSTTAPMPGIQGKEAIREKPNWKKIRVGIPKEYFAGGLDPEVEKAVQASIEWMKAQGAQLSEISLPHSPYAVAVYYIVAVSEASSNLARFDGVRFGVRPPRSDEAEDLADFYCRSRSLFGAEVKRRIILGTFSLSAGYSHEHFKRACQVRRKIKEDFDKAFQNVDLIVGPVAHSTAFKLGDKVSDPLQMYLNDLFTIPANLAGLPAISVPCGESRAGLPIGLHLMAPLYQDERLISAAHDFFENFKGVKE